MPAGDGITDRQRLSIEEFVAAAEQLCGLKFTVFVGQLTEGRESAQQMLTGPDRSRTVLTAVDPTSRQLEIVTGEDASSIIDDRTCALAALAMTSSFQAGELVGGLRNGINLMAQHARLPARRHIDTV